MPVGPTETLMHQVRSRPESTAFFFHGDVWTYRQFAQAVDRAARGLAACGVKEGVRVALHMMNRPEILIAYFACFKLGAVAAPLRTAFTSRELAPLLERLKPAVYIGQANLYCNIAAVGAPILPKINCFIVDAAKEDVEACGVRLWDMLLTQDGQLDSLAPARDKPAVLINTSGTTGQPKFVTHTPNTLAATIDLLGKHSGLRPDDRVILALAMVHMSGLIRSLTLIDHGIPFIILESFDADTVLDNVERYNCTWMVGFPYQYVALLDAQEIKPRDLSSLRICLTTGDVCPTDLQKRFLSVCGVALHNAWACSEAVGSLAFGLGQGPVVRIVEEAHVRLVNEHGVDVAHGEIGELLICGPNVFVDYWNDPIATAQSLTAGWFHTGDLMRRGDRDELWFVSRKKDIIIRGGTNISPVEIEEALVASHAAVEEAAVIGKPDAVLGQRVFAFVKLAPGAEETVAVEILGSVGKRLAPYKVPEGLRVVSAMPRNASGKVDRKALQAIICTDETSSARR
jgi:long-chain acyl-CoA synthetase